MDVAACAHPPAPPSPLVPQTSGTIAVAGLSAPVRVVRDRWGVPHIYAENTTDLFIAQGFVQAEDRLFQMDLWRRASLGRLAEVLGRNFIERDIMTRRMQYSGDMNAEWSSYGPDARAIAEAFTRGVNAWVARAHDRPPEEFLLAGWTPAFWSAADLLSRTDAFLASGDALAEIRRAGYSDVVRDAIRQVGPPAFFVTLERGASTASTAAAPSGHATAPEDGAVAAGGRARASIAGDRTVAVDETPRLLEAPSRRYVVHLHAPGWNVAGMTSPWLPGVVIGHNERVAWGSVPIDVDTQDVSLDRVTPADVTHADDAIRIKGRANLLAFQRDATKRGVVIATDNEHQSVFALRWSGFEAGAAAELAATAIDRADSLLEIRAALSRWKLPARRFVYASADGQSGFQDAALIPRRLRGEWTGWLSQDDLAHGTSNGPVDAEGPDTAVTPAADKAVFAHVLAIDPPARQRFNVGPVARPPGQAAPTRARFDPRDWDRSQVMAAPGASASPGSPHYADLASVWSRGEMAPLLFSDDAVRKNAAETLTLVPR